ADITLSESPESIQIEIEDHGDGVDDLLLEKLCQPYFRASNDKEGSGLGLTISQSIAKAHGGNLLLSHSQFGGLCATLIFPRD
ncbi:hypothetical protein CA163_29945, partial [Vibrio parahaemolyticus]